MNWLDCLKIYDAKRKVICEPIDISVEKMYEEFVERIGHTPEYNVWYDTINPKIFSADDTYINSPVPNEASFLDSRVNFLSNQKYGLESLNKFSRHLNLKQEINVDPDGFYQAIPELEKYKDSTILVVGGGPSTTYCNWENEDRDFTWSCNHFYKMTSF